MPSTSLDFPETRPRYLHNYLEEPEDEALLRLTTLVQHLFSVPVAYIGLLDAAGQMVTRIGAGCAYGAILRKLPVMNVFSEPRIFSDTEQALEPGFDWGGLRFAASVPMRAADGMTLGLLVIADLRPRPEFSPRETSILSELACVLAGKMELRRIAAQALESERIVREVEGRFRAIANAAPVPMACCGPDGGVTFVNRAWLDFTGGVLLDALGDGWVKAVHPKYREAFAERVWQALTARESIAMEVPLLRHDGTYRRMLVNGAPRFDEDGGFLGMVGCLTDAGDFVREP
jgi:PAS domain S-box-containing protein